MMMSFDLGYNFCLKKYTFGIAMAILMRVFFLLYLPLEVYLQTVYERFLVGKYDAPVGFNPTLEGPVLNSQTCKCMDVFP